MVDTYDPKTTPWQINEQEFPHTGTEEERLRFLLRYTILAPSSHNTQPWLFTIQHSSHPPIIHLFADPSRWLRVADPERRELHISIGCAIENLRIAAEHFGYGYEVTYLPDANRDDYMAAIQLVPGQETAPQRDAVLFAAIPTRHTNHNVYEDRPIAADDLRRLEQCCQEPDITVFLTDDAAIHQRVEELVIEGDARQFADPAYREELGYWVGQGVFGAPWLLAKMGQLAVTYVNMGKSIARQDRKVLMSAPVLGVIASQANDPRSQIRVGQVFERLSLVATVAGISIHPMSQPLELDDLRQEVAKLLPVADSIPQHTFRLGYAEPEREHTPRRPLDEVVV